MLHDVSFSVPAGQVVGIVGPSGSGKSTLAKLVQRLYVPESGRVLVDGVDLAMVDSMWLRRQFGIVLQENILFNRSIRDNIALAEPGMPIERVIAAATLAGAHDFILELPEGYDTIVGERGSSLSGGQRQRIAIARALLCEPRVLIFDEATSALDYESERIIQQNMAQIAKGRTVFIIAHRLSTVRFADRILTLEPWAAGRGWHPRRTRSAGADATRRFTDFRVASMKSAKAAIEATKKVISFPGARERREKDELAFLPAALEIVETPPSPIGRAIGATLIALFCLALIWASFGHVDIVASAPGKIVPSGRVKLIQPFETGVVRAIHIHDGQSVKAGEVLIELDPTMTTAEEEHIRNDLVAAQLDIARLRAALSDSD